MSVFEIIHGVEGCCLALDDTHIAGPKLWGGGAVVIHAWETDEEYVAVNTQSHWYELFGTPERAARTLMEFSPLSCAYCALYGVCGDELGEDCLLCVSDALLEWLRGDAE